MYWADELAASLSGPQIVNDSKSPSGTVHVGSLRGVVLHDAIHRALLNAGLPSTFLYGVDDMDAMDSQAMLTPDAIDRYMGAPLSRVPAPEGSGAARPGEAHGVRAGVPRPNCSCSPTDAKRPRNRCTLSHAAGA